MRPVLKKFLLFVFALLLLLGAGWAGFHAPEVLPELQRYADDALGHILPDDGEIHVEG